MLALNDEGRSDYSLRPAPCQKCRVKRSKGSMEPAPVRASYAVARFPPQHIPLLVIR